MQNGKTSTMCADPVVRIHLSLFAVVSAPSSEQIAGNLCHDHQLRSSGSGYCYKVVGRSCHDGQ